MKGPIVPPTPVTAVNTLLEYRAAGFRLITACSGPLTHRQLIDYDEQFALHGDVNMDIAWRKLLICPRCGAAGGLLISVPQDIDVEALLASESG